MTNANALPIQERLRDSPHALRLTREAADRIDALEKALREIVPMTDEIANAPATAERWADRIEETARAALGEGE